LLSFSAMAKTGKAFASLGEMPMRQLGRTGVSVSAIGLGGSHIGKAKVPAADAVSIIRTALDSGLNFLDNSWDYNDGESELRVGKALKDGYREKAFVMTKIDGRTKQEASRQIDESLKRLGTDHLDLLQHHEVIRFDDVDRIFEDGGAMEAFLEAREAGKTRFIGFTGHKDPHVHLYMLDKARENNFRFDTVQMPLNVMDAHFRSFEVMVLPELVGDGIGVLGMKSLGGGVFLKTKTVSATECLLYSLSLPTSVVITGIDSMDVLHQAFSVVKDFQPLSEEDKAELLARTEPLAKTGEYELFKTSAYFDSTAKNPEWLGTDSARIKALTVSA
jgi:aryl-alcohol dehydrogenase-like predicted oxidoreductase